MSRLLIIVATVSVKKNVPFIRIGLIQQRMNSFFQAAKHQSDYFPQ